MNASLIKYRNKIFGIPVLVAIFLACILYPAHGPRYSTVNGSF